MCKKPNKNGELGYSWDGKGSGTRSVAEPELPSDKLEIVYDEPGRCQPTAGGEVYRIDHHCHHYQLVRDESACYRAFVRHGGGTEEIGNYYQWGQVAKIMKSMDSDTRFVLFMSIAGLCDGVKRNAKAAESEKWLKAAAEKRIKTRKMPGLNGRVKVWIEPEKLEAAAA